MARNRIIWFCLWVLSVVGISLRGGAVTYGFFTLLSLVPVLSLLYLLAVYMLFHIYQELEQRFVSVNEPVRYRFALVNEYPMQFVSIRVRFFSEFSSITELDDGTEYELKPHSRIEKETSLICKYRGEYEIGIREIEIQDFFRLFRFRYRNKEGIHAVVRPQLIETESLGAVVLSDAVRASERSRTEPDILSREYVPGDDPRLINWSQSARTGTLMTRILTGSDHQEIALLTDTFRTGTALADFLPAENKVLETVLAISYFFSRKQICAAEYHLSQALERLSVESTGTFEEFYQAVSEIRFSSLNTHRRLSESVMQRKDLLDSSMLFLILSVWDSETEVLVKTLERNGMPVVICLIGGAEAAAPDLSDHRHCELIRISPFQDLRKELGA
ncbi:MAG: DUF58 domain-containing protein [Oscillospiraceae bacterium]|nr:DUF58 domain-containing protein [Oscillospiraceae bacterium]